MTEIGAVIGALVFLGSVVTAIIIGVQQLAEHLFKSIETNGRELPRWVKVVVPWVLSLVIVFALRLDYIGLALTYVMTLTGFSLGWADVLGPFWFGVITLFISAFFTGLGSNGFNDWWTSFLGQRAIKGLN